MSLMTAKQKHTKEQVIELFNQADMDEKQNEATGMNTYTIQDAQVERQRIAEQRRKREQKEKDDYWFRESVGLPNGRVPAEFLSGEFT